LLTCRDSTRGRLFPKLSEARSGRGELMVPGVLFRLGPSCWLTGSLLRLSPSCWGPGILMRLGSCRWKAGCWVGVATGLDGNLGGAGFLAAKTGMILPELTAHSPSDAPRPARKVCCQRRTYALPLPLGPFPTPYQLRNLVISTYCAIFFLLLDSPPPLPTKVQNLRFHLIDL
jgi:hypothetical protein